MIYRGIFGVLERLLKYRDVTCQRQEYCHQNLSQSSLFARSICVCHLLQVPLAPLSRPHQANFFVFAVDSVHCPEMLFLRLQPRPQLLFPELPGQNHFLTCLYRILHLENFFVLRYPPRPRIFAHSHESDTCPFL